MLAISEARSFRDLREVENLLAVSSDDIIDLLIVSILLRFLEKLSHALVYGFLELPSITIEEGVVIRGRLLTNELPRTLLTSPVPKISFENEVYIIANTVNWYILDTCNMLYTCRAQELLKIAGEQHHVIPRVLFELNYTPGCSLR